MNLRMAVRRPVWPNASDEIFSALFEAMGAQVDCLPPTGETCGGEAQVSPPADWMEGAVNVRKQGDEIRVEALFACRRAVFRQRVHEMASCLVPSGAIFHVRFRDIRRSVARVRKCRIREGACGIRAVKKQAFAVGSDGVIPDRCILTRENGRDRGRGGCTHANRDIKVLSAATER